MIKYDKVRPRRGGPFAGEDSNKEDPMKILIAEDEKDLNDVICKKLKAEGFSVDAAYDGEDALDHLCQQ